MRQLLYSLSYGVPFVSKQVVWSGGALPLDGVRIRLLSEGPNSCPLQLIFLTQMALHIQDLRLLPNSVQLHQQALGFYQEMRYMYYTEFISSHPAQCLPHTAIRQSVLVKWGHFVGQLLEQCQNQLLQASRSHQQWSRDLNMLTLFQKVSVSCKAAVRTCSIKWSHFVKSLHVYLSFWQLKPIVWLPTTRQFSTIMT